MTSCARAGENPTLASLSFLDRASVSQATATKCRTRVVDFLKLADEENLTLAADDEVDAAVVQYLNTSRSQGRAVNVGELVLAGLLFFQLQYGMLGG